ncbi:MAG: hypothetical protein EXQ83_10525 [Xanthobacteraceae bacterium]|nr:hypothetical protein [Xanthobacteraceae bacterium]
MFSFELDRIRPVLALLAVQAVVLGACSGSSPMSEFAFGKVYTSPPADPKIFPANYKAEVAEFLRTSLANPTKVKDAYIAQPVLKPVAGVSQYVTCVRYNPRDSKNQYEGTTSNVAIFLSGRLNQFLGENPEMCSGLAYQRYPELESMVP